MPWLHFDMIISSELIDFHGADTVVCPFTTGKGVGTGTYGMDNVFPPDNL